MLHPIQPVPLSKTNLNCPVMRAGIETVTETFLRLNFSASSLGLALKHAVEKHQTLINVLCTQRQKLWSVGSVLCQNSNEPLFALYAASLFHELDDELNNQKDKQTRLLMLAFPDLLNTPASPSLLKTLDLTAKADDTVVSALVERVSQIAVST